MKDINISTLKSHLSEELKSVAAGEVIVIKDRDRPIAKLTPLDEESMLSASPQYPFILPEMNLRVAEDAAEYLAAERQKR